MSLLTNALDELSNKHRLDPITDTERVKTQSCKLRSGEESLFVTMFCHEVQQAFVAEGLNFPFHEMFYCPSRRSEWRLGFDLSIGRGHTAERVRTMHKLLTGKLCDSGWTWRTKKEDTLHMALLMAAQEAVYPGLHPFLVIHVCYCAHDYRRMGMQAPDGCQVPAFQSPVRTVVLDLGKVRTACEPFKSLDWGSFIQDFRKSENKKGTLGLIGDFGLEGIRIVNRAPFVDIKSQMEHEDVLQAHCPILFCPTNQQVKDYRDYFLTFNAFTGKLVELAKSHWL